MSSTAREETITVFGVAVLLNYPWEMAQSVLYAPMDSRDRSGTVAADADPGAAHVLVWATARWMNRRDAAPPDVPKPRQ